MNFNLSFYTDYYRLIEITLKVVLVIDLSKSLTYLIGSLKNIYALLLLLLI